MAPPAMAKEQATPLANARTTLAKLPLSFIPNQGQFEKGVEFEARGSGYITSLTSDAAYIGLHSQPTGAATVKQSMVRLGFAGAHKMNFQPSEKQASYANYIGGPASRWHDHVPNYGRVTAAEVYPGIDTTFYGNSSHLQFDFVVKPGADPKAIQLKIDGGNVKLDENGDLAIATELGTVYQRKPVLYQEANGVRQPVQGGYQLSGDTVSFEVGAYDSSRTLVIDPVVNFSMVIGGGIVGVGDTMLNSVAADAGAIYAAGTTTTNTLNLSGPSTISGARAASAFSDAILVSLTRDGTTVIWYTFIGGSDNDSGLGVAIEDQTLNPPAGSLTAQTGIYLVGQTFSSDLALNAVATNHYQGGGDGYIISLNGNGSLQSGPKYIGGPNGDSATSVAVRCVGGCAAHAAQDSVFVGMFVGSNIAVPTPLNVTQSGMGAEAQAGAVVELRASTLGTGGVHGDVFYINATQSAMVNSLALLPFPIQGGALQKATQVAFVGTVAAPGGLNGNNFAGTNSVQAGHGGTDGFGFGGGNADGMWGVSNTQQSGSGTPLTSVFNLDYIGGAGSDNLKGVAPLPDGNIVVVGDTDALPFSTTGANGVINGNLPRQNTSFGTNGTAASGGGRDVVAAVINIGGIGATATANLGTRAAGSATMGNPANLTVSYGTSAVLANAAAGVTATGSVTAGVAATATITAGTAPTFTLTPGVQAVATAVMSSGGGGSVVGTVLSPAGAGYWSVPTVTFVPPGAGCTTLPTGHATIAGGALTAVIVDNAGFCAGTPTIAIQPPGIQALSVAGGGGGNGYQSGTGPLAITFTGISCTTGTGAATPSATATVGAGNPVPTTPGGASYANTNASITGVNVAAFGLGCETQPSGATTVAPGLQSLAIATGGSGYQGGSTVMATFTGGTCATTPTAQITVPGAAANTTLPLDNILTNSGSCSVAPTGVTLTAPGLLGISLTLGGTGYNSAHTPLIAFNGTCTTSPSATAAINNVSGNITGLTLTNSGSGCSVPPTTLTIDSGGITNVQVLTAGTNYSAAHPPAVSIAAPTGPTGGGHCSANATATATVVGGAIAGIVVTDPGCGYPTASNPTASIAGPGVTVNIVSGGTGYSQSAPPVVSLGGAFCTGGLNPVPPTFGTPVINGVNGSTGGNITSVPITNNPSCTGAGSVALSLSTLPGIVSINTTTAGNSYNASPTLSFPACTTAPAASVTLNGAAPAGISNSYTITSYGANCTAGTVNYTAPGLLSPPGLGQAFTITNPGLGYSSAPTVTVNNCTIAPQATATLAVPPATPGTLGAINLNTTTSGGAGCGDNGAVTVTLSGGNTPGFAALDYLGGTGNDLGNGVTTDANANIYIAGQTFSANFPAIVNPAWTGSTALKGASDGFVARITESGGTIQGNNGGGFSTYFGGTSNDTFNAIVSDQLLNVFVAGQTFSSDFPVTVGNGFTGNSDGTLTNLLFNNLLVTPSTSTSFTTTFGTAPASQTFQVNFANVTQPYSIAGGTVGGAPGTTINYSTNSGNVQWLSISTAPGGFTLNVNPGSGNTGLAPDNYSATFLINAPNADTPPVTFTVTLTVTAVFQTFNCTTPCTAGSTPVSNFNFTYTKAENNASTVTPAQQMLVGLVGIPANAGVGAYPAPGTFTASAHYNPNNTAFISTGITSSLATDANFKWFTIAGSDCSVAGGCTEPFGTNLAIAIIPSALDLLNESTPNVSTTASGTITFTQNNPGGGGITSTTITITATVAPRLVLSSSNPANLGYAVSCNSTPPAACTSINPSATNRILLRGKDDVINITSQGNANKMAVLTISTTPPGGSAACFTAAPSGVNVPAGSYQAPSSNDPTATDLSLPVQININNGAAACVQGVYTGTLTISGAAANLGAGDSVLTTGGITAIGPGDAPAAIAPVTVPVTITLGNELQSSSTSFNFGGLVNNSQEALAGAIPGQNPDNPSGSTLSVLPANQTGTVSLTLPPSGYNTNYSVTCTVNGIAALYTPVTGSATSSSTATCDWLTASISSSTLSAGSPTSTLTVGLTSSGTNNATSLPTNGGAAGNTYTGTIQLTYTSGTLAGSSLMYPVTLAVSSQPLNWFSTVGGTPATININSTVGGGNTGLTNVPCGSLFSTLAQYGSQNVKLNVIALANQTFATAGPSVGGSGGSATAGWLTVNQSGAAGGAGSGDALTCTVNIANLAPGTYTACIDAVGVNNPGPTPSGSNPVPAGTVGSAACAAAWPLFPAPGVSGAPPANSIGRTVEAVVLTLNAAPVVSASPSTFGFNYETGGTAPSNQTLTLTNTNASSSVQNVFASASVNANAFGNWLMISGPATTGTGTTLAASGNTAVTVSIAPGALTGATALASGTYNGVINLSCANCTMQPATIPVSLTIVSAPVISTVPGTLAQFNYQIGGANPASQNLAVVLSSLPVPVGTPNCANNPGTTVGCYSVVAASTPNNWLTVAGAGNTPLSGSLTTTSLGFVVSTNQALLNALTPTNVPYTGTVTITVPSAVNNPVVLNVSVVVSPQPTLTLNPTPASFGFTVGGTAPAAQTLNLEANGGQGSTVTAGFTASVGSCSSTATGGPANPFTLNGGTTAVTGITNNVTPFQLTVGANVTGITSAMAGVYTCTLTVASPGTSGGPAATNASQTFPLTLTVSSTPIINITNCSAASFAYTLTQAAATPATITCTVSDSSNVIGINSLAISGCPASWETCSLTSTTLAAGGSTTLTLTPSNLANQNPGTFGPPTITISGANATGGGNAVSGTVPGVSITNTPLISLTPSGTLTFGGASGYTQGNLQTPGNQTVAGTLAEGSGGTPAGPGTPGTGALTSVVAASSFAAGACTGGVTPPTNWLSVTQSPNSATGSTSTNYSIVVAVNPAVFPTLTASTTCTGSILVNSTGVNPSAAQKTIPVSFTINPQSGFSVSAEGGTIQTGGSLPTGPTIVMNYPVSLTSTAAPIPVTVSSAPTQGQQYTVTIQPVTGGNWLTSTGCTVSNPCTASAGAAGFSLGVAASANTLAPGSYFATVSVASANSSSSPNNTVTFTVTLTVDNTAALTVAGNPALSGGAFSFGTYFTFFTPSSTQTLMVATASPSAGAPATPASFTVTQTSLNGSTPNNLLVINGTQPFTTTGTTATVPVTLTFNTSVANSLGTTAPGIYGGTVTVTVTQAGVTTAPQSIAIPWSITIDAPAAIQTTPTSAQGITINCILGTTCTSSVGVAATSTGQAVNIPVTATVTSLPTPWLSITSSPTAANGASIAIAANTTGLQANTSYAGQVVVTSADASNSPYTVPVTLNVIQNTCLFQASNITLTSAGTSTGGVLPENPQTVAFTNTTNCTGSYSVTSNASWLTATGGTGVTFTALSNPHSTNEVGSLTITNTSSAPGYTVVVTVTEAGNAAALLNRQVTALYQTMLGRDPDSGGYAFWTGIGSAGLGQMADSFTTSPEFFNSAMSVMAAWQAATGAPPTYAEFIASVSSVRQGTQTISGLFSSLIASNSAYSATTLYQNLLNRTPTATEISNCSNLGSCFTTLIGFPGTVSPVSATNNEFQSTGTFSKGTDHSNVLYVRVLYYTILNRDPDSGGLQFWLNVANSGGPGILFQGAAGFPTRIQIMGPGVPGQGFIGSPEFVSLYQ